MNQFLVPRCTLLLILLTQGCSNRALLIPNSVSDQEYSVYSAWIKHHFKEQPPRLLLAGRTFIFDPLGPTGCNAASRKSVSYSLLRTPHDLGEAEFPIQT